MLTKALMPKKGGYRWAVGDIHGRPDMLIKLLKKIKFSKNDVLYTLGDYIDRGYDSKGVLDLIMRISKTHLIQPLTGNHELMLLMAYKDPEYHKVWKDKYGAETLSSFDIANVRDIDSKYIHFILGLAKVDISGDHVMSHAGIDFQSRDAFKDTPKNRMEILFRDDPVPDRTGRYRSIIGHRTKTLGQCLESATGPLIHVDAGCGKRKTGALVAYCLDDNRMEYVKN